MLSAIVENDRNVPEFDELGSAHNARRHATLLADLRAAVPNLDDRRVGRLLALWRSVAHRGLAAPKWSVAGGQSEVLEATHRRVPLALFRRPGRP